MARPADFVIAGGGTGGHLYPALALGAGLQERDPACRVHYVGSRYGIEKRQFAARQLDHTLLPVRGFQRGLNLRSLVLNMLFPARVLHSYLLSKRLLEELQPRVVIGVGGYASGLPLLAAVKQGIPTLIQEQNSYPGFTTRRLAGRVDRVCIAFPEAGRGLKKKNFVLTGNPVRPDIARGNRMQAGSQFQLDARRRTVFLFGGSQGSARLNRQMAAIVPDLTGQGYQVLWQTGERQYPQYRTLDGAAVRVLPFIEDMACAYALADLVISRAGALTIAELAVCGKPSILVPLAIAAGDHQTRNARSLVSRGAALAVGETELSPAVLRETCMDLLSSGSKLAEMSTRARAAARPEATGRIVDLILELAES